MIAFVFLVLGSCNATFNMVQNAARQRGVVTLHSSLDSWLRVFFATKFPSLIKFSEVVAIGYVLSLLVVLCSQWVFIRHLIPAQRSAAVNYS